MRKQGKQGEQGEQGDGSGASGAQESADKESVKTILLLLRCVWRNIFAEQFHPLSYLTLFIPQGLKDVIPFESMSFVPD